MTHILRNMNAFLEGYSTHLEVEELTTPKLMDQSETTKAGGLGAEYDVSFGLTKLEASIKLTSLQKEGMKLVGLAPGVHKRITFRGRAVSEIDGSAEDHVIVLEGRLQYDPGNWTAQSVSKTDYKLASVLFYKHTINGAVMYHVDLKNMVQIVDGVDQMADTRSSMGR